MLVGRDREEALVDDLLDAARDGRSAVLAIVGEPGIGKSALLGYAESRAGDLTVLRARGIESEAHIPFAGLFELLRPALGRLDDVAPPQREALEAAMALRPARPHDRFAIGAATLALLSAFADEGPVLLVVDDAHRLDGSSADALLFAIRRLEADGIAVVLAARTGEPSPFDHADVPMHHLVGLDRAATGALVERRLGSGAALTSAQVDRLHRGTGGNPLALIELPPEDVDVVPGALDVPLPVSTRVARTYLDRCASLPEAARDLLLLVACSDDGDLSTVAKAATSAGVELGELAAAEAVGLVTVVGDRIEFCHPLARAAVHSGASAPRRRDMHRALSRSLPDADADRRAWHLALATIGPDEAASSSLEQAGARARSRSAYDVASQAFERAAGLTAEDPTRARLLLAAADAAWLGGRAPRALELLDRGRRHAPPVAAIELAHLRGHITTRLGHVDEGRITLLEAADLAAVEDPDRAVLLLAEAVYAGLYAADPAAMRDAAGRIAPLVGARTGARAAFLAATAQGMALIFGGERAGDGGSLLRSAVAIEEGADDLEEDPWPVAWAAVGPLWLRDVGADRRLLDRAVELARSRSAVGVLPFLLGHVAVDDMGADRWATAEAGLHEAVDLASEGGQRSDLVFSLARLAWLEGRQGKAEPCTTHAAQALDLSRRLGLGLGEIWSLAALGDLHLALGDLDQARDRYGEQHDLLAARGVGDPDLSPAPELVELHLRRGDRAQAETLAASYAQDAEAKGQPWALARAARCRGLLAPDDEIDAVFADALAGHERTPDLFERSRTRLAYGQRLRRARQPAKAREQLRAAAAGFERLGAVPWADVASGELDATGETARRRVPSTRDELTPRERQVAIALAAGRTTREAAAGLFLSPKTVEHHLWAIYRKLGINSRAELAAAMARADLDP